MKFHCKHCGKEDAAPEVIYPTSQSARFEMRLCAECFGRVRQQFKAQAELSKRDKSL